IAGVRSACATAVAGRASATRARRCRVSLRAIVRPKFLASEGVGDARVDPDVVQHVGRRLPDKLPRLDPGVRGHALIAARTADLPARGQRVEVGDRAAVDAVHHRRIDQIANLETRDEVLVEADPKTRADLPHEARTDASELQALVAARELDPRAADACAGGD